MTQHSCNENLTVFGNDMDLDVVLAASSVRTMWTLELGLLTTLKLHVSEQRRGVGIKLAAGRTCVLRSSRRLIHAHDVHGRVVQILLEQRKVQLRGFFGFSLASAWDKFPFFVICKVEIDEIPG